MKYYFSKTAFVFHSIELRNITEVGVGRLRIIEAWFTIALE